MSLGLGRSRRKLFDVGFRSYCNNGSITNATILMLTTDLASHCSSAITRLPWCCISLPAANRSWCNVLCKVYQLQSIERWVLCCEDTSTCTSKGISQPAGQHIPRKVHKQTQNRVYCRTVLPCSKMSYIGASCYHAVPCTPEQIHLLCI